MRNRITQIIAVGLLLVSFWGNGQYKLDKQSKKNIAEWEKYTKKLENKPPEVQAKMRAERKEKFERKVIDTTLSNSDYIFEAEFALDSNQKCIYTLYRQDSVLVEKGYDRDFYRLTDAFRYYKLFITKIYKGGKELKTGTILIVDKLDNYPGIRKNGIISIRPEKQIYVVKKSIFPKPVIINDVVDNSVFINYHQTFIRDDKDSVDAKFFHFTTRHTIYRKYYNVEQELLKGRKGISIKGERKEQIINYPKPIIDTVGNGLIIRNSIQINDELDTKQAKMLQNYILNDSITLKKRNEVYEEFLPVFPKTAKKYKEKFIDNFQPKEIKSKQKGGPNARIEEVTPGTVSVQLGIRNKQITSSNGLKFYEFDATIIPSSNIFVETQVFHFTLNSQVFGINPANSGKITIAKAPAFSNIANKYVTQVDNYNNGFTVQFYASPIVAGTSTTPPIFNRVQISGGVETTLFHIKIAIIWNNQSCDKNLQHDFTLKSAIEMYSIYATTNNLDTQYNFSAVSYFQEPPIPSSPCAPIITEIVHNGYQVGAVRGGTEDFITIKGAGFGDNRNPSVSKIEFKNADVGGIGDYSLIEPDDSDYINWSDSEINVKVPSLSKEDAILALKDKSAGSGTIKITNLLNSASTSSNNIKVNVPISFLNRRSGNIKLRTNFVRQKCVNGIEFVLHSSVQGNQPAINAIEKALADWNLALGSSYQLSLKRNGLQPAFDNTPNPFSTNDKKNIISFGNNYNSSENGAMVTSRPTDILPSPNKAFINNTDIGIRLDGYQFSNNTSLSWDYNITGNSITNNKYDFYGAFLHEVGHTLGLNHIIEPTNALMYYATEINPTSSNRFTLTSDGGKAIEAVQDIINLSINLEIGFTANNVGKLGSVSLPVSISANNGNSFCTGQVFSTLLAPTYSHPYFNENKWFKDGLLIATAPTYTANAIGSYSFNVGSNGCTTTSNVITITQPNLTPPTISASKLNLCGALDNTTLTTSAPFGSYTWRKNNAIIPNSNFNSFNTNTVGNYDLIGSTNGCTTTSNVVTITQNPTPTPVIFSNFPTSTICALSAQLNSNPNCNNCQWRNNGINIPSNQGGNTVFLNFSTAGKYDLLGTINDCPVVSNVLTITQIGRPVLNTNVVYSAVPNCIGTISITSNSSNTYKWFFPNNNTYYLSATNMFTGQTSPTFVAALANIQLPWRVDATNCAGTSTTFIPVNGNAAYLPSAISIVNYTTLGSCQAQIQLTSNNAISYQWFAPNSSNSIVGANLISLTAPLTNVVGNYTARLTNACGSTDVAIPLATQNDKKPAVSITLSNIVPTNGAPCVSSGSLLANVTNGFSSLVFMKGGNSPIGTANANPVITSYTTISNSIVATAINACGTGISNSVRQPNLCSTGCIPS
ncbi:MAG: hypothetical protein EAZ27_06365 [Cytophagales bacterium]|nr:MAG: hypothetical protein EAZ27_06365 [Cytophagales bacterium]